MFWLNTNKTIWEGRVVKTTFSDFPEDAKHLKLIWIKTNNKDRGFNKKNQKNTNAKVFLYQLIDTSMEGLCRNECWILQTTWDIRNRDWQHQMSGILKELLLWSYVVRILMAIFYIHNYLWMKMITIFKNN